MTYPTLVPLVALLVEGEVELAGEDGGQLDGVLEADGHAVRVHLVREPDIVLDLLRLGHLDAGAGLGVHHHVVGFLRAALK